MKKFRPIFLNYNADEEVFVENPTAQNAFSILSTIMRGWLHNGIDDESANPDECILQIGKNTSRSPRGLLFQVAFDPSREPMDPPQWVVVFRDSPNDELLILARQSPSIDRFEVKCCVGHVERYRVECLLDHVKDADLIRQAIEYFLKHRSAAPDLVWLPYFDCAKDDVPDDDDDWLRGN